MHSYRMALQSTKFILRAQYNTICGHVEIHVFYAKFTLQTLHLKLIKVLNRYYNIFNAF